ncbi:PepSY domain-containing protein [Hazenella sp. IB182357]|uniref:PepSY domain-containing protein n=2 Tax=Polycladospora coralii TaxID=2771432 RepID=A0A926RTL8_9BACL|nr:PepSY domain-containing protein [Polycladospora coralii]
MKCERESHMKQKGLYQQVWRWHFFAGILFSPILIILAVTGSIYLFKPQIENVMYQEYRNVEHTGEPISASLQLEKVRAAYPEGEVVRYIPASTAEEAAQAQMMLGEEFFTVFINPYDGTILGKIASSDNWLDTVAVIHGELMAGTIGDAIVELSASWAVILLATGLFLWWPRNKKEIGGTFFPRLRQKNRIFWKDIHAVSAFWFSSLIMLLILTGLPWSGVWGDLIQKVAVATNSGYPDELWGEKPESTTPSKEVADVPWAAETLPVPASKETNGGALTIDQIIQFAEEQSYTRDYRIDLPEGETGVYTLSVRPDRPEGEATLHIDQYSGQVLTKLTFDDYGKTAQLISIGIALHEGRYFGIWNQILGLFICLALIGIVISGWIMWWKRKPKGKLGSPQRIEQYGNSKSFLIFMVILGILLPLAGLSIIVVYLLDWLIIKRIPALKNWLDH